MFIWIVKANTQVGSSSEEFCSFFPPEKSDQYERMLWKRRCSTDKNSLGEK